MESVIKNRLVLENQSNCISYPSYTLNASFLNNSRIVEGGIAGGAKGSSNSLLCMVKITTRKRDEPDAQPIRTAYIFKGFVTLGLHITIL